MAGAANAISFGRFDTTSLCFGPTDDDVIAKQYVLHFAESDTMKRIQRSSKPSLKNLRNGCEFQLYLRKINPNEPYITSKISCVSVSDAINQAMTSMTFYMKLKNRSNNEFDLIKIHKSNGLSDPTQKKLYNYKHMLSENFDYDVTFIAQGNLTRQRKAKLNFEVLVEVLLY